MSYKDQKCYRLAQQGINKKLSIKEFSVLRPKKKNITQMFNEFEFYLRDGEGFKLNFITNASKISGKASYCGLLGISS